jgi:UTP--glucose-1-phosphate uridylyltransferase
VSVASEHVGQESFAVMLGDDIMVDDARLLRRMLEVRAERGGSVLALMEVEPDEISAYGCAEADVVADDVRSVRSIVEKPKPEDAPSNLAVIGRYVFGPEIFDALDRIEPGVGGELQLTDAIGLLLGEYPVHGVVFSKGRYDIGKKVDFLRANVELALDRPDLGPELATFLAQIVRERGLG